MCVRLEKHHFPVHSAAHDPSNTWPASRSLAHGALGPWTEGPAPPPTSCLGTPSTQRGALNLILHWLFQGLWVLMARHSWAAGLTLAACPHCPLGTASAGVEQHKLTYNEKPTGPAGQPHRWRILSDSPARPSRSGREEFRTRPSPGFEKGLSGETFRGSAAGRLRPNPP